jgi:hypothetical protein
MTALLEPWATLREDGHAHFADIFDHQTKLILDYN